MTYEVIRRLARGGMGVVDLARGPDGSEVALKRLVLGGTAAEMAEARQRFLREIEVLRQLDHEAVVPVLDVLDDAGEVVLVMPFLAGGTLTERVQADGPLPADEVLALAERLLPALAAAHRLGIVHRDIKPSNILFDVDGNAHLADFGVALTQDATAGLTRTGIVLGTPGFLAPEQARGDPVTAAADISSLGATLHFAATGASPYAGGEAPAVLLRTARGRAAIDRDLDTELRSMLIRMLAAKPDKRPTAAALAGGAAGTNPIPVLVRRHPGVVTGVAAALVAIAAFTVLSGGNGPVSEVAADPTTSAATSTSAPPCVPLKYQPCGGSTAPNTDGRRCVDDHADYDGFTSNGCEAVPDVLDGTELVDRIAATIVPADDTDTYPLHINDAGDLGCNNTFRMTLTAPSGTSLRLELLDDEGNVVAEAVSADGVPGDLAVSDPRCFRGDGGDFAARVSPAGSDRSGDDYVLTRSGSF